MTKKYDREKLYRGLVYLIVVSLLCIYLGNLIYHLKEGVIAGADWNNPVTKQQYSKSLELASSTWKSNYYLGLRNSTHNHVWYIFLVTLISRLIGNPTALTIILILIIQLSAIFTTYLFARELRINKFCALVSGISLAISPIFFNYLTMGWIYVLLDFSLLNLSMLLVSKSLTHRNVAYVCLAGVIYGLSFLQVQAMLWIPLIVLCYMVFGNFNRVSLLRRAVSFIIFILIGILINSPTVLQNVVAPNKALLDSGIVKSKVSVATSGLATPANTIRLLGSGYNSQYESSQLGIVFSLTSFILPLLIIYLLKNNQRNNGVMLLGFTFIFLLPILAYLVGSNREIMARIPGSAIFRDVARFSFVSTFAAAILVGYILEYVIKIKGKRRLLLLLLFSTWLVVMAKPWVLGELTKQPAKTYYVNPDVRLRTVKYPSDYFELEKMLEREDKTSRALFVPIGSIHNIENDENFNGPFREIQDSFSGYSPIPGVISVSDRQAGPASKIHNDIDSLLTSAATLDNRLEEILRHTSTNFVVVKTNSRFDYKESILLYLNKLVEEKRADLFYRGNNIEAYRILFPNPRIYLPQTNSGSNKAELKFSQINPTNYNLWIKNSGNKLTIIFTDSFDEYWQLTNNKDLKQYYQHNLVNGYANGWDVDIEVLCSKEKSCVKNSDGTYDLQLTMEFYPQRLYSLGLSISLITGLTVILLFTLSIIARRRSRRHMEDFNLRKGTHKCGAGKPVPAGDLASEYLSNRKLLYSVAMGLLIATCIFTVIGSYETAEFAALFCYLCLFISLVGDVVYRKYIFDL